jgi:hypothetical protein
MKFTAFSTYALLSLFAFSAVNAHNGVDHHLNGTHHNNSTSSGAYSYSSSAGAIGIVSLIATWFF